MPYSEAMNMVVNRSPEVLFCILDWGLGHATRSMPIIHHLIDMGYQVTLASDGRAQRLLKEEFPRLTHTSLIGYQVRYPFKSMIANVALQWPRISYAMLREHLQVSRILKDKTFDLIISDNRYGCFDRSVPSVLITHQINPPVAFNWMEWVASKVSRRLLKNFTEVWIPDDTSYGPLNGKLVASPPAHAKFIGFLSRLKRSSPNDTCAKINILAVLSGPEPARSRFEKKVVTQLKDLNLSYKIVRGLPEGTEEWRPHRSHGQIVDFLTSDALEKEMCCADVIISRSGYTSLMDYIILGVRAIVVPTPGQYEQEYLAENLPSNSNFRYQKEKNFNIKEGFKELMESTDGIRFYQEHWKQHIDNLLIRSGLE